jgi:hypothetical protein
MGEVYKFSAYFMGEVYKFFNCVIVGWGV